MNSLWLFTFTFERGLPRLRSQSWIDLNCAQKRLLEFFFLLLFPSVAMIFKVCYQYLNVFIVVTVRLQVL